MALAATVRISIFPLSGAILYPGLQLPLHIFEPRYRALVSDALARDRRRGRAADHRVPYDPERRGRSRGLRRRAGSRGGFGRGSCGGERVHLGVGVSHDQPRA